MLWLLFWEMILFFLEIFCLWEEVKFFFHSKNLKKMIDHFCSPSFPGQQVDEEMIININIQTDDWMSLSVSEKNYKWVILSRSFDCWYTKHHSSFFRMFDCHGAILAHQCHQCQHQWSEWYGCQPVLFCKHMAKDAFDKFNWGMIWISKWTRSTGTCWIVILWPSCHHGVRVGVNNPTHNEAGIVLLLSIYSMLQLCPDTSSSSMSL